MDAIKFIPNKKQAKFLQIPLPTITQQRQVLVKVAYSGICGTDLHIIEGKFPCNEVILGHEFSGIVINFSSEITNLSPGDHVVVDPNNGCHKCHFCHSKTPNFCTSGGNVANLGTKNDGGWAQYCLCSIEQVHKVPKEVSLKTAALAEPLSCIAHGWDMVAPITIGQEILVMGGGIIGTLWCCLLHFQGHRKVTVAEINESRLGLLNNVFGDSFDVVNTENLKNYEAKFDVVIDCTGYCPAIELGISLLNFGGKICLFGVAPPNDVITVSPFDIYLRELKIMSVKINPFSFNKAIDLIQTMEDKYLNYDKLGIKIFKLEEFSEAIKQLKIGRITKAVFKLEESEEVNV